MFQALADPTRRVMVERLSRGPTSVSDLAQPLAMSLSAVVQHLQVPEASGLVRSEKVGLSVFFAFDGEIFHTYSAYGRGTGSLTDVYG